MQVGSKVSYEINKDLNAQGVKSTPTSISAPTLNTRRQDVYFAQNNQTSQGQEEEKKKSKFTVKNITNTAGVILGVSAIAIPLIIKARKPVTRLKDQNNSLQKLVEAKKSDLQDSLDVANGKMQKGNWWYQAGVLTKKLVDKNGDELINNVIYGIGTVIVMPLIILFSPFGKKKSSKEDKMFTVLRQPLSFATMFSMQLTVDKMIKGIMPKIIEKNLLEPNEGKLAAVNAKGEIINHENLKFNDKELKKHFEGLFSDKGKFAKKLDKDDLKKIFLFDDPELMKKSLNKILENKNIKNEAIEINGHLQNYLTAKNSNKVLSTGLTILTNVLFSAPVGCTLLNVIYGKTMKNFGPQKNKLTQENTVKGGK